MSNVIPEKWSPHGYQKRAIEFGISHATAGFLLSPGLGKTSIMLAIFCLLRKLGLARRMLVVAPLRPAWSTWPGEVARWKDFAHLKITVLHGADKDRAVWDGADIHVINPEGLKWLLRNIPRRSPREPWPYDILVVDESTRFKHTTTERFKTIKPMLREFSRRYILTGSPAPNGLMDLFGQVYILDLGNALGGFITHFRSTFFHNPGNGMYDKYVWIPNTGAEEAIYKRLKPLVLRMAAEDYLTLPPLIFNKVYVDLPPTAVRIYKQMESVLVTAIEDDVVTAANAAAMTNKCRQIANGGIYHEGGEKWSHIHEAKVDAVEEIVEELSGQPALVAYEFKHDLDRLQRRFGEHTPFIGGGVSAGRFREIERDWNAGKIPVLFAQPQSVAHGLNLQGTGAAVINAGQTWNLEDREQFIARVWRQGQKEKVIVHDIVARGTIDEMILRAVSKKDRTQKALLAALKDHYVRRAA